MPSSLVWYPLLAVFRGGAVIHILLHLVFKYLADSGAADEHEEELRRLKAIRYRKDVAKRKRESRRLAAAREDEDEDDEEVVAPPPDRLRAPDRTDARALAGARASFASAIAAVRAKRIHEAQTRRW